MSEEERQTRLKNIDTKEKQLNRDAQRTRRRPTRPICRRLYGKVAQKVSGVTKNYVQQNGFTLLLDVSNPGEQRDVGGADATDVTQAVVDAYNKSSGDSGAAAVGPFGEPADGRRAANDFHAERRRTTTNRSEAVTRIPGIWIGKRGGL